MVVKMKKKKVSAEKKLEKKVEELTEQLKKAVADYHNLEKRLEKEVSLRHLDSKIKLVDKLLGVLDDLERAENHLRDRGLSLAVSQFRKVLASEGVKQIKTEGARFDPALMDCVEVVKGPKDVVVETLLKGYTLDNQVVRPAKVKVGSG